MPTVSVPSVSVRIHSWLSVYLRSAGSFIVPLRGSSFVHQHDAVPHERRLDHSGVELPVADFDRNGVARHNARGNAGERDRFSERGRERTARDLPIALRRHDLLMAAQDAALVDEQKPDQRSGGRAGDERSLANEVAIADEVDRPGEPRFEWVL